MLSHLFPVIAMGFALAITAVLGFAVIPFLKKLKFGQTILDIGPKWHAGKEGTPTMGGIMFITGIIFALLISLGLGAIFMTDFNEISAMFTNVGSQYGVKSSSVFLGVLMALLSGMIGFIDDYIKVVKKRNLGLTATQKTVLQFAVAAVYLVSLFLSGYDSIKIPFVANPIEVSHGWGLIFWPIALLFIYGFINSVNLTDGIDGLCTSVTLMVSIFFVLFSIAMDCMALEFVSFAAVGGCLGFLIWNHKPAKVFMGDTGSLFLGGLVVAMAFASGYPVLLILVGIVYLLEALSDIIQVAYYKKTKKRIFKMAPIHHHFEMCGWSENKIVIVFSAVTIIGGIISAVLLMLSIR